MVYPVADGPLQAGIRAISQEGTLCPNLTVLENLSVVQRDLTGPGWRGRAADLIGAALDAIFPGHRIRPEGSAEPLVPALVAVEGHRWSIEDSFETAKNELGLDHNETRSWHGWHRHVSLVMLAFAMMAIIRNKANANAATPKKTPARWMPRPRASSAGRSRKSGA